MTWIKTYAPNGYISDSHLMHTRSNILVTYQTATGRKYVASVECLYGRVSKKINGKIIAWMPTPEPYTEQGAS